MKFLLDTGDIKKILEYKDYIEGVTTNPIILEREGISIKDFYVEVKDIIQRVFLQLQSESEVFTDKPRAVYKIPLIFQFYF